MGDESVLWEPPASLPEIRSRKWRARLEQLQRRPGAWGRLETYTERTRARRGYHYLRDKYGPLGYEFSYSQTPPNPTGRILWGVYGRWTE